VCICPATTARDPWLADGFIAWHGAASDGENDDEGFRLRGTRPADALQPMPPLLVLATPGDGRVALAWDRILGATAYNVYLAERSGVTKDNYLTLPGGRKVTVTGGNTATVTGLRDYTTYYFVVTAVAAAEGGNSQQATATPVPAWSAGGAPASVAFAAVAADRGNAAVAYAAGAGTIFKTADGGATWNASAGLSSRDIRALAVDGQRIYAATRDGDLLRSTDGGANWQVVADGADIGEVAKSLALDPRSPATLYAGDFRLAATTGSYVVKSTNGGTTWASLPDIDGGEIHAYAIAVDPQTSGTLYAGGTGTPNLVKSVNGGTSWTSAALPGQNYVYSLAIDPGRPQTLYAGTAHNGVYRSLDGGTSWTRQSAGLPAAALTINALIVDPAAPGVVYAATFAGVYRSANAGASWIALNNGLATAAARSVAGLTLTASRRLVAATGAGLFLLDASR
jgi:photosystem II stability/assembly factor-like uncharacterized protein